MAQCQTDSSDNPKEQSLYALYFPNTAQCSIREIKLLPEDLPVTTTVALIWQRAQQRVLPTQWEDATENGFPMGTKHIMQIDWKKRFVDPRTIEQCRHFFQNKRATLQALKNIWSRLPIREQTTLSLSIPEPTPYLIQNIDAKTFFAKEELIDHVSLSYKTPFGTKYLKVTPYGYYQIVNRPDEFSEIWIQDPILSRGFKENKLPENLHLLTSRLPIMEERFFNDPMTKEPSYSSLSHNTYYPHNPTYEKINYGSINLSFTYPNGKVEQSFAFCSFLDDKGNTRTLFINKSCYFFIEGIPEIPISSLARIKEKAKGKSNPDKYIREETSKLEKELFRETAEKQFPKKFYRLPENVITHSMMERLSKGSKPWDMLLSLVCENEMKFQGLGISQSLKDRALFKPGFSFKKYCRAHQSLPKERIKYQFVDHGHLEIQDVGSFSYCTFKQPDDKTRTIFISATTRTYFIVQTNIRKESKQPIPEEIVRRILTPNFIHPLPQVFSDLSIDNLQEAHWKVILSTVIDDLILPDEIEAEKTLEKVKTFFPNIKTPKGIPLDPAVIRKAKHHNLQKKVAKTIKQLTFHRLSFSSQESRSISSISTDRKSPLKSTLSGKEGYLKATASVKARYSGRQSLPSSKSIPKYVAPVEGSERFLRDTHSSKQKKSPTKIPKKHSRIPSIPSKDSLNREEGVPNLSPDRWVRKFFSQPVPSPSRDKKSTSFDFAQKIQQQIFHTGSLSYNEDSKSLPPPTPSHRRVVQKNLPSPAPKVHSVSHAFFAQEITGIKMDPDISHRLKKPRCIRCKNGSIYGYLKDSIRDGQGYLKAFNNSSNDT